MGSRWSQKLILALGILTALLGVGATGCMGERAPINRVQPNFLDKEQLIPVQFGALQSGTAPGSLTQQMIRREPTWVHQVTIIDKPATTGFQGISWYTDMERVNFEVTENFLIARQAYDQLANGQSGRNISQNPRQGEILAVYRISSHFDIRRSYNPTTGEELNVIEENASDRPWYQRRYMRIDWTQNLVSGYSAMSFAEWEGRVRAEPGGSSWVDDPSDPNRPVFNYGEFNGRQNTLTYFDVTNRAVLHPEEVNLASEGYPNIPACLLIANPGQSCRPSDVTMRVSFMRLDPNRDYEPQALDGHRMDRFGFFESSRIGYDRDRNDRLNTERRHMAARHNLWMQHHARPANNALDHLERVAEAARREIACDPASANPDWVCQDASPTMTCDTATRTCGERYVRCTADADCAAVGHNSSCDIDIAYTRADRDPARGLGYGLCTLPYRQRTVRPIPYHLSPDYPERFMMVTEDVVRNWNEAFSQAVMTARWRECMTDPAVSDRSTCEAYRTPTAPEAADAVHVYVGCHNPVWGTAAGPGQHTQAEVDATRAAGWDTPACGPQGTSARLGDVRYSMIGGISDFDVQGAWGLANISGDPITGEVFSGRGAVWSTVTELQAAYATDLLRVMNGDLSPEQIANGENVLASYGGLARFERTERDSYRPMRPRAVHRDISSRAELETMLNQTNFSHLSLARSAQARASAEGRLAGQLPTAEEATANVDFNSLAWDPSSQTYNEHAFMANAGARFSRNNPIFQPGVANRNRLERLRGSDIEMRMINSEELAASGFDPSAGPTNEAIEAASPARRNNIAFRAIQNRIRSRMEATQCNHEAEFNDEVLVGQLHRFQTNQIPEDVSFGRTWNFRLDGTNEAGNPNINWDEVRTYLVSFIHRGVLAHELGHSIGERHNFGASADTVNYFDRYWELRGQGHANRWAPRFENMANGEPYYSQQEEEGGVEEYAYSTVMDYKGFNEDAHGLGRYDFAFVAHGYVNLVEAFRQVADQTTAINMFQTIGGGGQQNLSFGLLAGNQLTSFHYTRLPSVVGTTMRNGQEVPNVGTDNRFWVFLNETSREAYNSFNWSPDHTNVANAGPDGAPGRFLLVPYRMATDDQAGVLWYNMRYDAGADMFETLRYKAVRYLDYYFANSFARERVSFTVPGYRSRMSGRFLEDLYYVMRVASIYEVFYADIFGRIANRAEWEAQPATRANRLGVATVIDTFANAVLMPQSSSQYGGQHTLRNRPDGTRVYEEAQFGDSVALDIGIGDGRDYETRYDWASGFFWRDRMINAGAYHDKVMGLQFLTETFLYAPDRTFDVPELRNYQVNMFTVYPAQSIRFFGSLLSRDHQDVGPLVQNPGARYSLLRTRVSMLNLPTGTGMGQNGRPANLNAVDPNLGFTGELWTAVLMMANLSGTFDQRLVQNARLWADGDVNAPPAANGLTTVQFTDPATSITYRAIHFGGAPGEVNADVGVSRRRAEAATNETGIGARMILHANELRAAWEAAAPGTARTTAARRLQQYVDLLNIMRNLNREYGTGVYGSAGTL